MTEPLNTAKLKGQMGLAAICDFGCKRQIPRKGRLSETKTKGFTGQGRSHQNRFSMSVHSVFPIGS
jgi:hypothetical protein